MLKGQFSQTALSAAAFRAAHQSVDNASIFRDPYAAAILGEDQAELIARNGDLSRRKLRMFVALRSRIAEETALRAIAEGARQVVVLGAGLDTFAYRLSPQSGLRVYEVDHPDTQAEKRRCLAGAGIAEPGYLTFAPCDFERQPLGEALAAAGFNEGARAAYLWLGVTPYLTPPAIAATLCFVAGRPGGADIVFDYTNPPEASPSSERREYHERMAERVAAIGEAFQGYFATPALHALLGGAGFTGFLDLGPREIAARLRPGGPVPPENGGHILRAWKGPDGGRIASGAWRATVDPE